jgi:flagellar biosynthesis protein FlhF
MNVKRFTGRNSREAMQKVKAAFGDDAVVLSTKPAAEGGIEILAMAGDSVPNVERLATDAEPAPRASKGRDARMARDDRDERSDRDERQEPSDEPVARKPVRESMQQFAATVHDDVKQLAMSTLSFQDYVRERMLKRREAALQARTEPAMAQPAEEKLTQRFGSPKAPKPGVSTAVDLGVDPFEAPDHREPLMGRDPQTTQPRPCRQPPPRRRLHTASPFANRPAIPSPSTKNRPRRVPARWPPRAPRSCPCAASTPT